ncbi:MAG: murein biosynthesis integral membrane protein MurJ [Campylobacterota bacterium]
MKLRYFFTNSVGILVSRILGFLRDLLTASTVGANIYSDIFFVAFKLPNLFRRIFAEGAFMQTFLPSFAASKHRSVFSIYTVGKLLVAIAFLTLLVILFSNQVTKLLAFGFDAGTVALAAPLVAINFFYLFFIFLVTFLGALLQYKNHFATTAFATALLNISMITALLLYQDAQKLTIVYALSYAVVIGGFLQLVAHIIAIKVLRLCPLIVGGFTHFKDKSKQIRQDVKRFNRGFLPAMWGNSTAQIAAFVDTWLASFLASGAISYLYYANRVFQLPLALFAIAASIALFPSITKALKNKQENKAQHYLDKTFWVLLYLLSFSTIGGFILSREIVWLLFERGAFSASDSAQTAAVLQMYMIGLLFFGMAKLFSTILYATHRQGKAAKIATFSLLANIILSIVLIIPLEAVGLALASSLSGVLLLLLTVKEVGFYKLLDIMSLKKTALFIVASALFIGIVLLFKGIVHGYL